MPDSLVPVRDRVSFSKLDEALPLPDLVGIQRGSFDWLLAEGLKEVLEEVSPIEDFTEQFQLHFGKHVFKEQKFTEEECKDKDATFSAPLFVEAMFVNKTTGEIKEQEIFMGDFPLMTELGTFIINGAERVVVSQLVRSPGVTSAVSRHERPTDLFIAKIIPSRGAWLKFMSTRRTRSGSGSTASAGRTSRSSSRRSGGPRTRSSTCSTARRASRPRPRRRRRAASRRAHARRPGRTRSRPPARRRAVAHRVSAGTRRGRRRCAGHPGRRAEPASDGGIRRADEVDRVSGEQRCDGVARRSAEHRERALLGRHEREATRSMPMFQAWRAVISASS